MNKAAQELAKLSLQARIKKYGGKEGFSKHMSKISRVPKPRKKVYPQDTIADKSSV